MEQLTLSEAVSAGLPHVGRRAFVVTAAQPAAPSKNDTPCQGSAVRVIRSIDDAVRADSGMIPQCAYTNSPESAGELPVCFLHWRRSRGGLEQLNCVQTVVNIVIAFSAGNGLMVRGHKPPAPLDSTQ